MDIITKINQKSNWYLPHELTAKIISMKLYICTDLTELTKHLNITESVVSYY